MECVIETKANIILDFIHGLRGELHVTFEEGTWATWLYDLLKPHVTKLVVCDPGKNSRQGNKNDRIDARELVDRLYMNKLSSVYHGGGGVRTLKELARSYHRAEWLAKITEVGVLRRAEFYFIVQSLINGRRDLASSAVSGLRLSANIFSMVANSSLVRMGFET
jgi:hypothetical protein